ncbi:CopG family transcriptional regulator [Bacillus thuringiensis]|uniref:CopG family transcriptional regulator n=1 Tax=Bacillus thuringiensis TaxID=1428 RepID=UPI000A36A3ED|nr:CopG family transcriptional regulator [Bacillus thuringiensis]MED3350105.1 CopG family transcriptional regulator [Bacillus thuringiensis]MRB11292.1 CopG family transcriptional regulator [Bacillus thuringiensis]OTW88956.1 CopG family transcriptional regulator [Bacillus thuringiensis serovar sumiyoshiensis]OTW95775.1 CopG family transcriptional regulator [Bacillus thuringiensis serovar fukuokaensis]
MNIKDLLQMLKENRISIVAKEIGISQKKLSKAMKAAGYQYNRSVGWHCISTGEPPLEADIRDFIGDVDDTQAETMNDGLTKNEVNVLREIINELSTTQNVVNAISHQKENVSKSSDSQKNTSPIHSLYMCIREGGAKEKVSRTVNLDKGTCSQLGTFEDVLRINRDDIIEIALREFFEKYKAQ